MRWTFPVAEAITKFRPAKDRFGTRASGGGGTKFAAAGIVVTAVTRVGLLPATARDRTVGAWHSRSGCCAAKPGESGALRGPARSPPVPPRLHGRAARNPMPTHNKGR